MFKNKFLKKVISSSLISAIFLNSGFVTHAKVLVKNNGYKTQENLKCEQKVNKKNNLSETLTDFLLYGTVGLVGIGGIGCPSYKIVELIKNRCNELDKNSEEKPKEISKPKTYTGPVNNSPFANLQWSGNDCYIDATLQVMYESKTFREYVKKQAEENSDSTWTNLNTIFDNMAKYKNGGIVPHDSTRKEFEKSIGHTGSFGAAPIVFLKLNCGGSFIAYNDYDIIEYLDHMTIPTMILKHAADPKVAVGTLDIYDSCFDFSEATKFSDDNYEFSTVKIGKKVSEFFLVSTGYVNKNAILPTEQIFNGSRKFKLKAVTVRRGCHFVAYKLYDATNKWYLMNDLGSCYESDPVLNIAKNDASGVTLAYYQEVK